MSFSRLGPFLLFMEGGLWQRWVEGAMIALGGGGCGRVAWGGCGSDGGPVTELSGGAMIALGGGGCGSIGWGACDRVGWGGL